MFPLPEPFLIDAVATEDFMGARGRSYPDLESWDTGGAAFSDPAAGLFAYDWHAWTDGKAIACQRADLDEVHVLIENDEANITEIDFTFNQNMQPHVVFLAGTQTKLRWFDPTINGYVVSVFEGLKYPRIALDDKRRFNAANSDIIFAYIRNVSLCYRLQRDKFAIEYVLVNYTGSSKLYKIGMTENMRFGFHMFPLPLPKIPQTAGD